MVYRGQRPVMLETRPEPQHTDGGNPAASVRASVDAATRDPGSPATREMTARRPEPVTARTGWTARLALPAVLLLIGAGVRALRFVAPFHWPFHWDETIPATPALRVLTGALPITAGPEYFGAAPWYPLAPWFAVAGTSTVALDLYSYGIGLLILWTTWLLLRRFLDGPAALFGLAILAVPPLFLAQWSLMTANHVPNLFLGNLCLLATHTIFVADYGRRRALLVFGLLAGLGWWTSPLILVYLAPFAVLAARTGLLSAHESAGRCSASSAGCPVAVRAPVLPLDETRLHGAGAAAIARSTSGSQHRRHLPRLIGYYFQAGRPWRLAFFLVAVPLWIAAVITALVRDRASFAWLVGRRGTLMEGRVILWMVAAANIGLLLATKRRDPPLLPPAALLGAPLLDGRIPRPLRRHGPLIAAAALASLLALNGWANWQDSGATRRPAAVGGPLSSSGSARSSGGSRPRHRARLSHLGDPALVVRHDLPGRRAGDPRRSLAGAVRGLRPARRRRREPADRLDAGEVRALRDSLQAIGVDFRETAVGGFRVLEPEPRFSTTFVPLPRDRWTITASHNPERAADLLDGDAATTWTPGLELMPGAVARGRPGRHRARGSRRPPGHRLAGPACRLPHHRREDRLHSPPTEASRNG